MSIPLAAAIALATIIGLPATARTVCNASTMSGVFIMADDDTFCRINLRYDGRYTGSCRIAHRDDETGEKSEADATIRGRFFTQANCQIYGPFVLDGPGGSERSAMRGYAWGGDVPMAFHIVSITRGQPRSATFVRLTEFDGD